MLARRDPRPVGFPVLAVAVSPDDRVGCCIVSAYFRLELGDASVASQWHEKEQPVEISALGMVHFKETPGWRRSAGRLWPNSPRQEATGTAATFLCMRLGVVSQLGIGHALNHTAFSQGPAHPVPQSASYNLKLPVALRAFCRWWVGCPLTIVGGGRDALALGGSGDEKLCALGPAGRFCAAPQLRR